MSASREKKIRQNLSPETMDGRQHARRETETAQRRKTVLYTVIGVVVALAVAALLVWDSGFIQGQFTAATIGDKRYSVADVSYYYHQTKNNFINQNQLYSQMGLETDSYYSTSLTPAQQTYSMDEETGETITYEDYFRTSCLEEMQQVDALCAAAEAEGYTLSEDGQSQMDSRRQQIDDLADQYKISRKNVLKSLYGPYVTEAQYMEQSARVILAADYLTNFESSIETTDETIEAYYQENKDKLDTFSYRILPIYGKPEATYDENETLIPPTQEDRDAAMVDAEAKANAMKKALLDGADFAEIAPNYVPENERGNYTDDTSVLRSGEVGSNLPELYRDWLCAADRQEGDVEVFEDTDSFSVVQFVSRALETAPPVDMRHILIKPETDTVEVTDEATGETMEQPAEPTEEQWAAAKVKAQEILDGFLAGEDLSDTAFAALVDEHSQDERDEEGNLFTAGGLYTGVSRGDMPEFDAWLMDESREVGDTGLVRSNRGWNVMYFVGTGTPVWKDSAAANLTNDALTSWLDGHTASYEIVESNGMTYVS